MSQQPRNVSEIRLLELVKIRRDGGTQCRLSLDEDVVREFADLMTDGVTFPPVRVWYDGSDYWLSDGFHRVAAAEGAGYAEVSVEVMDGTLADAKWDSCGANSGHGLRRTKADLLVAIRHALMHPKSAALSNVAIAKHLGLPEPTLRRWRRRLCSDQETGCRTVSRNGTTFRMKVTEIGKVSARSARRQIRTRPAICVELQQLRADTSPDVRSVINVVLNWASGGSDSRRFVSVLEQICSRWRGTATRESAPPTSANLP